jgi:hypothetical protein
VHDVEVGAEKAIDEIGRRRYLHQSHSPPQTYMRRNKDPSTQIARSRKEQKVVDKKKTNWDSAPEASVAEGIGSSIAGGKGQDHGE